MFARLALVILALVGGAGAAAAAEPAPLFESDTPIHLTIRGPLSSIASTRSEAEQAGALTVAGTGAWLPVHLSARGVTRRKSETCGFPPLRVEFTRPPPANSAFAGQHRLKLVTHCRAAPEFQQHLLLEYSAYRLYNLLTPRSFRVRLANIDYVDQDGRPYASRLGIFIEDVDDVAGRNGMLKFKGEDRVPVARLEPRAAVRVALFEYMIGNLDWSMRAGLAGDGCCHNSKLLVPGDAGQAPLTPVPYDFDQSGLVDAPYALPPAQFSLKSVRERKYRGFCAHNVEARAVSAEMVAKRGEMLGLIATLPGLAGSTKRKATAYLEEFFRGLKSGRPLQGCVG
jgi:hypothetical protein